MSKIMNELQNLKGIGEVLSRRLVAAGYDSLPKVAAADEDALKGIPGINPRLIQSILSQAREQTGEAKQGHTGKVDELRHQALALRGQVQEIAGSVRERFQEDVVCKSRKRIEKEILRVITSLEKVEGILETRGKKAGKVLVKAEKRLEGLAGAELKGVGKGLKKARKSLDKVLVK